MILWKSHGYKMLTAPEAPRQGYLALAAWLEKCDEIWKAKQGEKAGKMRLVTMGQERAQLGENFIANLPAKVREGSLGRLRSLIREKLREQLAESDAIVSKIL